MSLHTSLDPHAHCSLVRQFVWELTWRPERHIYPGMSMELRCHRLRAFHHWRFVRCEVAPGDIEFRWKVNATVSERRMNPNRVIVRARFPYGLRPGDPVRIRLTAIPGNWLGIDPVLSVWVSEVRDNLGPDAEIPPPQAEAGSDCRLHAEAGPVERLAITSRPAPGPEGTVRTVIAPEDRFGNPTRFSHQVPVAVDWNGTSRIVEVGSAVTLELEPPRDPVSRAIARVRLADLPAGETVSNGLPANGLQVCAERVVTGNPVWRDPVMGQIPVFGEFHWHTDFSGDGQRPIRDALRCARDEHNLDFAAPGDHNPRGEAWTDTVAALEEMDDPDRFATFFGWERSSDRGHENYYFTDPDHPLRCGGSAGITGGRPADTVEQIVQAWRERRDFIVIPHHTNAVAETRRLEDDSPFWHPYPWGEPQPFVRQVEIMQTRGNQERDEYTDAWRGWHQHNGSSVQDALALGYRLGFVGGTDNHCGRPGRAFETCEGASVHSPRSEILTGLWVTRNRRAEVFGALFDRRSWAVWDTRALVDFSINGVPAGGETVVTPGTELNARIRLSAEDALRSLELVSATGTIWSTTTDSPDVELTVPLGRAETSTWVYLRAMEHRGGLIYASPVYVDVRSAT